MFDNASVGIYEKTSVGFYDEGLVVNAFTTTQLYLRRSDLIR